MKLKDQIQSFLERGGLGADPFAEIWRERRADWSLFSNNLSDHEIELLRPYLFPYKHLPESAADEPVASLNFSKYAGFESTRLKAAVQAIYDELNKK